MDSDPKDIWTMLKTSWTPQPRWLSAEGVDPVSPSDGAPIVLVAAQHGRQGEPVCIPAFNGGLDSSRQDEAPATLKERRKIRRELRAGASARDVSIQPVEEKSFGEPAMGYCKPTQETTPARKTRSRKRVYPAGNVVELRPRSREEVYAIEILKALCSACEAHAAGEEELMMARIRMLYHMFDELAG